MSSTVETRYGSVFFVEGYCMGAVPKLNSTSPNPFSASLVLILALWLMGYGNEGLRGLELEFRV